MLARCLELISKIKRILNERNISIYRLSKLTEIKYELLRRTFAGERKLLADELILILNVTGISFEEIK